MKGTIKAYSSCVNAGVIDGADGKSYRFHHDEWTAENLPQKDETVTFEKQNFLAFQVKRDS